MGFQRHWGVPELYGTVVSQKLFEALHGSGSLEDVTGLVGSGRVGPDRGRKFSKYHGLVPTRTASF